MAWGWRECTNGRSRCIRPHPHPGISGGGLDHEGRSPLSWCSSTWGRAAPRCAALCASLQVTLLGPDQPHSLGQVPGQEGHGHHNQHPAAREMARPSGQDQVEVWSGSKALAWPSGESWVHTWASPGQCPCMLTVATGPSSMGPEPATSHPFFRRIYFIIESAQLHSISTHVRAGVFWSRVHSRVQNKQGLHGPCPRESSSLAGLGAKLSM